MHSPKRDLHCIQVIHLIRSCIHWELNVYAVTVSSSDASVYGDLYSVLLQSFCAIKPRPASSCSSAYAREPHPHLCIQSTINEQSQASHHTVFFLLIICSNLKYITICKKDLMLLPLRRDFKWQQWMKIARFGLWFRDVCNWVVQKTLNTFQHFSVICVLFELTVMSLERSWSHDHFCSAWETWDPVKDVCYIMLHILMDIAVKILGAQANTIHIRTQFTLKLSFTSFLQDLCFSTHLKLSGVEWVLRDVDSWSGAWVFAWMSLFST